MRISNSKYPAASLHIGQGMITACPICKTLSFRRALCSICAGQIRARLDPVARVEGAFTIYSLFAWERDGWRGLTQWIYALKGKETERFWREPAVWALDIFGGPPMHATWVPVPSSRARNHARGFARALAAWAGGSLNEALQIPETGQKAAQKRLTRGGRAERRFIGPPTKGPIVLVDDVVTTGATARAAHLALGSPKAFQVWCLADRRPCGDRGALL